MRRPGRIGSYRAGGTPPDLLLPEVSTVHLDNIFFAGGVNASYDLVKIDVDGLEGAWLAHIEKLLSSKLLHVRTFIVECHQCAPSLLHRMQHHHGYGVYALDMHIDQRFLNSRGIDVYSHFKELRLPTYVDEMFSIRLMRHLYSYRQNMTFQDWQHGQRLVRMYCNQYIFTKEHLLEPRWEHPDAVKKPSKARLESHYQPPPDGI